MAGIVLAFARGRPPLDSTSGTDFVANCCLWRWAFEYRSRLKTDRLETHFHFSSLHRLLYLHLQSSEDQHFTDFASLCSKEAGLRMGSASRPLLKWGRSRGPLCSWAGLDSSCWAQY